MRHGMSCRPYLPGALGSGSGLGLGLSEGEASSTRMLIASHIDEQDLMGQDLCANHHGMEGVVRRMPHRMHANAPVRIPACCLQAARHVMEAMYNDTDCSLTLPLILALTLIRATMTVIGMTVISGIVGG